MAGPGWQLNQTRRRAEIVVFADEEANDPAAAVATARRHLRCRLLARILLPLRETYAVPVTAQEG